jgi:hypothetical protein
MAFAADNQMANIAAAPDRARPLPRTLNDRSTLALEQQ